MELSQPDRAGKVCRSLQPWRRTLSIRSRFFALIRGQDALCLARWSVLSSKEEHAGIASPKYKRGEAMASRKLPAQRLQEIRDFAAQWGKIIARRALGEASPDRKLDFQAMEEVAAAA